MRLLSKIAVRRTIAKGLFRKLHNKQRLKEEGYFYDNLSPKHRDNSIDLSSAVPPTSLIKSTVNIINRTNSQYPLWAFNDLLAGWKNFPYAQRHAPLEVESEKELIKLLTKHLYFRDRRADNYYLTNSSFEWFIWLCHHGDWHFAARPKILMKFRVKKEGKGKVIMAKL